MHQQAPALCLLALGGLLAVHPASAEGIPTYGVCFVEYYDAYVREFGGKQFVSPVFTVLEDAQDKVFLPGSRYTSRDTNIRPLDVFTNVDQVRRDSEGEHWKADQIQFQFYDFAGGNTTDGLSGYGCRQFLTKAAADGFIARLDYDVARLRGWQPKGSHVVANESSAPPAKKMANDPPPRKPSSGSGGALIVEKSASPVVPGWDEKVREQLRRDADAHAKSAALTAANDAKIKAEVAEAIRRLRAQGRAQ